MSWLTKLLPPRIKSTPGVRKTPVPEGLWVKCVSCEAVLYRTDLEKNLMVCPKCGFHTRISARARIDRIPLRTGRIAPRPRVDRIALRRIGSIAPRSPAARQLLRLRARGN